MAAHDLIDEADLQGSCEISSQEDPTLPPPQEEEPTPEEIEGLKAIVKEHGYELLV